MSSVWLDDRLVPAQDARVGAFDHGLTVGDGIFETIEAVGGDAVALTRHLQRLRRSAAGLGLEVPWTDDELRAAVGAVLDQDPAAGRVRLTVTGGPAPLGSERGASRPTLLVAATTAPRRPPTSAVVTVEWTRNERSAVAGLKTTSYAENVVALAAARSRGGDEAVLANTRGELCEGTGSNVFLARGGRLLTPPLTSGCLAGTIRALVCELCDVVEEAVPLEALAAADEAFLTSSTRRVHPIATVDGTPLPAAPGPLTSQAAARLDELLAADLDP